MLAPDNKKIAAIILAGRPSKDEEKEPSKEEARQEGLMTATEEILSASKKGDAKSLMRGLQSFFEQCSADD